eukprot:TRINITY_DN10261_c0_g1_i1.p1 TRINITY_DN10261_c0_g1~~TRINITY_DN10261_c0_g1_i1.p1  ORF type:complete len:299 (-),score=45.38 TRINITY_DN10261_c0_g1_i1:201-1097(-)
MAPPPQPGQKKTFGSAVIAGGAAGAIEATLMFPAEFVKTQLQLDSKVNPKFQGPVDCVVKTIKSHGPLGLYRGLSALVVGSAPKAAVRFTAYEAAVKQIAGPDGKMTPLKTMLAGLCGGVSEAIFVVTPMEAIKTRLIHDLNAPVDQRKYRGLVHGVVSIGRAEGAAGLYAGLFPTILKQGSNQAVRFLVVEEAKKAWASVTGRTPGPLGTACCGAVAGAASVFANNPIDVVKTKMQGLDRNLYKSSWNCAVTLLRTQGPMVFYRGVTPRLIRVCGDSAIAFSMYGEITKLYNYLFTK